MKNLQDCFSLSNEINIPCLGFGTWRIKGDEATTAVIKAIETGYRHIDTAAVYNNEKGAPYNNAPINNLKSLNFIQKSRQLPYLK